MDLVDLEEGRQVGADQVEVGNKFMNESLFNFLYSLAHKSDLFDSIISFLASDYALIISSVLLVYLFEHKDKLKGVSDLIVVIITAGATGSSTTYLKLFFHTLRPFEVFPSVVTLVAQNGFAFPSGHTAFFMAIATSLWFCHKRLSVFFGISAVVIGTSRVIAGIHWPIDILGGLVFGFIVGVTVYFVINKLKNIMSKN